MRVSNRKIDREGTSLGGEGLVVAIGGFMDPGCFGSTDLVLKNYWDSQEVIVKHWFSWFPVRIRNRHRVALDAELPKAHPNQHQPGGGVSVLTVVDAKDGFHVG
jgi:hypothetical protein